MFPSRAWPWILLATGLLTLNWRITTTRRVTTQLPPSTDPTVILLTLHDQRRFIALNPLMVDISPLPNDPAHDADEWFQPTSPEPIQTYQFRNAITLIPGIGAHGQWYLSFPTWVQNTVSGVRGKSEASLRTVVGTRWTVDRASAGDGWTLRSERRIECVWWLMPFVAYTYDGVNGHIRGELLKLAST